MDKNSTLQMEKNLEDSSQHGTTIDLVLEKKLVRKCDLHVVPVLFVLFLMSFLDRTNIGNARIQGLEKDLGMDPAGNKFNIALQVSDAGRDGRKNTLNVNYRSSLSHTSSSRFRPI